MAVSDARLSLEERVALEKRLAELEAEQRDAKRARNLAEPVAVRRPSEVADTKTLTMLVTIGTTLVLSMMGLLFMYYYRGYRVAVLTLSCTYIALYGAFVTYVTNKVDEENCLKDKTLTVLLKGSTIVVLFLAIMIALATILLPLIEPKKPAPPGQGAPQPPRFLLDANGVPLLDANGNYVLDTRVPRPGKGRARKGPRLRDDYGRFRDNRAADGRRPNDGYRRDGYDGRRPNDGYDRRP